MYFRRIKHRGLSDPLSFEAELQPIKSGSLCDEKVRLAEVDFLKVPCKFAKVP